MTRVGVVFGCFIPLHRGHIAMIDRARSENDRVVIGVTGHDMDRGMDFVPFLRRVRLMDRIYHPGTGCVVAEVDDRAIGLTGTFSEAAWKTWCDELFRQAGHNPNDDGVLYTWYTGEPDYVAKIRANFPDHSFVLLDRAADPISGTKVREDYEAHAGDIHPLFLEYLREHPRKEK